MSFPGTTISVTLVMYLSHSMDGPYSRPPSYNSDVTRSASDSKAQAGEIFAVQVGVPDAPSGRRISHVLTACLVHVTSADLI